MPGTQRRGPAGTGPGGPGGEGGRRGDRRGGEGRAGGGLRTQPQGEEPGEVGTQGAFADHAAEDGHRVEADLHDGEVVARLLLHAQHPLGARIALVGHLAQAQATRSRQRDLGQGEEGAGDDQRQDEQQALDQAHDSECESGGCADD